MAKRTRLFDFETFEVSQVPKGMNKRKFLLFKEMGDNDMKDMLEKVLKADIKNEEDLDKAIDEILPEKMSKEDKGKMSAAIKGAIRLLSTVKEGLPNEGKKLLDMLGKSLEVKQAKEDKTDDQKPVKKEENKKETKKEDDVIPKETQEKLDELFASNEKVTKENERIAKENADLKEEVKKERDARILKEFEDKAESFGALGQKKTELAKLMKEASETMSEDAYKAFEKTLKEANDKVEAGAIFSEIGTSQGGSPEFDSKLKVAKEAIMKEDPKLTQEQAEAKAYERDPSLYNQYLQDHPKQGGY